jgi:alpha-glucosidase
MHATDSIGPIHIVNPALDQWLENAKVTGVPDGLRQSLGLDGFYQKYVDANGIPVVSSGAVLDAALIEAGYLALCMLQNVPDVVDALSQSGMRIAVMATGERTQNIPEHATLDFATYGRCRGVGGTSARSASSCAEENLLACPGDPYWSENIFVHEFSHTIHRMGLDANFDRLLKQTYNAAMARGLWNDAQPRSDGTRTTYAGTNYVEYWAEGVQSYFSCNSTVNQWHNGVNGREALRAYDPDLCDLIAKTLGDDPWNYVPVRARWNDQPHLRDVDRSTLPRFAWRDTDPPG